MRNLEDPRQQRLFDPYHGLFSPQALKVLAAGWQGVFRHVILASLPVVELASNFHPTLGAPTKELYSMAGLVFFADFHGWTAEEAAQAYMFHTDLQYALNLEPGPGLSSRTVERYRTLFRTEGLAAEVFESVATALTAKLDLNVARQRLDSTHLFSHMATFGRTRLMAVAIKRFLSQVKRHDRNAYAELPEDLRDLYEPAQSQLLGNARDEEARRRSRQQVAEDLLWVIGHFADRPDLADRPSYKALQTIFDQQCELIEGRVAVRVRTGADCLQNPSDPDATYDGHKGPGYQVQIAETCSPENDVQLITEALPQTACTPDEAAVGPMLERLAEADRLPEELLADAAYASDENVQIADRRGVELIGPITGCPPEKDDERLTLDDFAIDERNGKVEACPTGHAPLSWTRDEAAGRTRIEMAASACGGCPFRDRCPITKTAEGRYVLRYTDAKRRLAARRREQETAVFRERYAPRSGIESTNSGLKNRVGLGRLPVRGRGSVFRMIWHKLAGWNVLRAAASKRLRAWVAERVAETTRNRGSALIEQLSRAFRGEERPRQQPSRRARWSSDGPNRLRAA